MRAVFRTVSRAVFAAALLAVAATAAAQVNLTFDKTAVSDGVWLGTVGGDVTGRLVSTLIAADQSQPVWQVELYWIILADDPAQSFVARMSGTLDTVTGAVEMSGEVSDGYQAGSRVVEAGQLQNAETSNYTGTIQIETTARLPVDPLLAVSLNALGDLGLTSGSGAPGAQVYLP